jgi:type II secretory pathway component PulF
MLAWTVSIALYLVVSRLMFPDVAKMFDGLGAQPPLPARVYFVLSAWVFPVVAAVVLGVPIMVAAMGKRTPERLQVWSRRYALTAILGVGWGLLAVSAWYLCVSNIISALK